MTQHERRPRTQKLIALLRDRIASGQYPNGSFLPSERRLAGELGVARNTLRLILGQLEREGRVFRAGGRGVIVRSSLGSSSGALISVLLPHMLTEGERPLTPEGMALLGGTLCAASRKHLRFQLGGVPRGGATPLIEFVRGSQAAGVIFIECRDAKLLATLREQNIPYVVVNQERDIPGPASRVDFWSIGREAAEHLLALGHRRLGVLVGLSEWQMYDRMLAGFRGRAAESEVYIAPNHVAQNPSDSEVARARAIEMLTGPDRPTAIFGMRDVMAYGAYLAARELGLRVPEDLSLIGYDDLGWPGQQRDFLTTFQEPTDQLGATGVEMLLSWIDTGKAPEDAVIKPKIIVRNSTGPAPSAP